jgi:hypothetical protein
MATRKSWNHKKCAAHRKVEGYTSKVCILPEQDEEQIVRFAEVMYRLATAFRRRIPKPAVKRKQFDMHDVCGGHFTYPAMGKVCYGSKRMNAEELEHAKAEAFDFAKEIEAIMQSNPRYARFYTGTAWR